MPLSRVALILMAKHPTPGKVKTRLTPDLTPDHAAAVHGLFLRHLVARLARLGPAELVICFDPADQAPAMRALFNTVMPLTFLPQCAGDLGARLAAAARELSPRHARLLFLGVDSPDVPVFHLFKAAELTEQAPVSLSPTADGGYWSLGLCPRQLDVAALLRDIPWSSGHEAFATLQAAEKLGLPAATGMAWEDVDRPEDLRRLVTRLIQSQAAADRELLLNLRAVLPAGWCS